jgi:hypothetical protein
MENLDKLCAEYGNKFSQAVGEAFKEDAKKAEKLLIDALGVLQEQGLYAFVLYCESRGDKEKKGAEKLKEISKEFLKNRGLVGDGELLEKIREELASKPEDLIFAVQVLAKSLIYARYHAKAMSGASPRTVSAGEKTT